MASSNNYEYFYGRAEANASDALNYKDFIASAEASDFGEHASRLLDKHGLYALGVRFRYMCSKHWWNRCYISKWNSRWPIKTKLKAMTVQVDWHAVRNAPDFDFATQLLLASIADALIVKEGGRWSQKRVMRKRQEIDCLIEKFSGKIDMPAWMRDGGLRKLRVRNQNYQ